MTARKTARPEHVTIGPYRFAIEYVDGPIADDDEIASGVCKIADGRVLVNAKVDGDYLASTLVHEALHLIFAASGVTNHVLKNRVEEQVCAMIEGPLLALLRDNPSLVKFLTA